jgi:hypothetical protein
MHSVCIVVRNCSRSGLVAIDLMYLYPLYVLHVDAVSMYNLFYLGPMVLKFLFIYEAVKNELR